MKKVFSILIIGLFFFSSVSSFSAEISSLIENLGNKDKAKDASIKLAEIGKPALPALIKALEKGDKYQKRYAARAIRIMGQDGSGAIYALAKVMESRDAETREYAVEALGNMPIQLDEVIPVLKKAKKDDSNKQVREKAEQSISDLCKKIQDVVVLSNYIKYRLNKGQIQNCILVELRQGISSSYIGTATFEGGKKLQLHVYITGYDVKYSISQSMEEIRKQKELAQQEEQIKQNEIRKQKELAQQEEQKKQNEIRKQQELAEQGNVEAQYSLGLMYCKKENYNEAVKWLTKAAKQGHAGSQFFLGQMYFDGKGVSENYDEAMKWAVKAAEQGNKDAQVSLLEIKNAKETLKVKGFYIGMSMDKAVKLLNEKYKDLLLNDGKYITDVYNDGKYIIDVPKGDSPPSERPVKISTDYYQNKRYYFDHYVSFNNSIHGNISIKADESGKVFSISFDSSAVNKLFNVKDMDGESFAEAFVNNYSIPLKPEMTMVNDIFFGTGIHVNMFWTYTSDKGFKVTIDESKRINIEKVASKEERKFD